MVEEDASDENENEKETEEKEPAKPKYEFIEDLPGVGPATAQKLRELGYHQVESLAMATSRELEPVGVSEKKAFQIIEAARSAIGVSFVRADELYKMRQSVLRLSTGSKALNKILSRRDRNPNNNRILRRIRQRKKPNLPPTMRKRPTSTRTRRPKRRSTLRRHRKHLQTRTYCTNVQIFRTQSRNSREKHHLR